jgi:hypothetical protein
MDLKERERTILREFEAVCADFPSGRLIEHEEPDFLILNNGRTIGLDLVDYVRGQRFGRDSGGSALRREDNNKEKVARLGKKKYEAICHVPLSVTFDWKGLRYLRGPEVLPSEERCRIGSELHPTADFQTRSTWAGSIWR